MVAIKKTLAFKFAEPVAEDAPYRFIASTDSVDREGDVMVPDGMDSTEYDRNPVVLWLHDSSMPGVARTRKLHRYQNRIEMDMDFPARPADLREDDEWPPDKFRSYVRAGLINAVSIRARVKDGGWRNPTAGDRAKYGGDAQRIIARWILEEISLVPLPMNQDAVLLAIGKGIVTKAEAERWFKIEVPAEPAAIAVAKRSVDPIRIVVPAIGRLEAEDAVRVAMAKVRGAIYAD